MNILSENLNRPRSRRDFLRSGMMGLGVGAVLPVFLQNAGRALAATALNGDAEKYPSRILVVVELAGGNDGINTVVPYGDDQYYANRPTLGIPANDVLKIDGHFGFHPQMQGFERLFKDGKLAVVHGCSYPNPNRSHFESMEFWHTGVPNGADSRGWLGRFADEHWKTPLRDPIVNIGQAQTLAVASQTHPAIVFSQPEQFVRRTAENQMAAIETMTQPKTSVNKELEFLTGMASSAGQSSDLVRDACARYNTPVQYPGGARNGLGGDLRKVAALISAGMPTRIYYVSMGGFDSHSNQGAQFGTQGRNLNDVASSVAAFQKDLERLGRDGDVAVMVFTEFGRRLRENASRGTDHGVATPMFLVSKIIKGGQYGAPPSLTDLDAGDIKMTTDFRRVYATALEGWMGHGDASGILKGSFERLPMFA